MVDDDCAILESVVSDSCVGKLVLVECEFTEHCFNTPHYFHDNEFWSCQLDVVDMFTQKTLEVHILVVSDLEFPVDCCRGHAAFISSGDYCEFEGKSAWCILGPGSWLHASKAVNVLIEMSETRNLPELCSSTGWKGEVHEAFCFSCELT